MTTFHNVRLPEDVERGADGGPEFKTLIMELQSGHEQRNVNWSRPRQSWNIGYGIQTNSDLSAVRAFFYAREGRAFGFRFKDWGDYEVGDTAAGVGELIYVATGGETTVQARKPYASGGVTYYRDLTRLVADTLRVWKNDVELTESVGFTADDDTGIITVSALSASDEIKIACEFDVPVRFDVDKLNVTVNWKDAQYIPHIPVIELRPEGEI